MAFSPACFFCNPVWPFSSQSSECVATPMMEAVLREMKLLDRRDVDL